jgi:hypothetical protein
MNKIGIALFPSDLDYRALILKTFIKSNHSLKQLGEYVKTYSCISHCAPSDADIDVLCPFGYPEWR